MGEASIPRVLWFWLVPELLLLVGLTAVIAASLLGLTPIAAGYSRLLRLTALVVVLVELAIPTLVYLDLRRRPESSGTLWVHAAAMPVLNLVGFVAYLVARQRDRTG